MLPFEKEQAALESALVGKTVAKVFRHRVREFGLEFTDGSRVFADADGPVEMSLQGGKGEADD